MGGVGSGRHPMENQAEAKGKHSSKLKGPGFDKPKVKSSGLKGGIGFDVPKKKSKLNKRFGF